MSAAAASAALLALAVAPSQADFTLQKCSGADIQGRGASFQNNAQAGFIELFGGASGCNGSPIVKPWDGAGSGAGRRAFGERSGNNTTGARDPLVRYVGADEAPNPTQEAQINAGPIDQNQQDVSAADNGKLRVIPILVGATTVAVNYPDGCTLPPGSASGASGDDANRLKLSAANIEKVFAAQTTTWGALVPGIDETVAGGRADGSCAAQQIKRIVRFEDSGTTFSLKQFLNVVNGQRGWGTGELAGTPNTKWPLSGGGNGTPAQVASGQQCTSELCSGTANGGGVLTTLLSQTDGAFGYADIRTARQNGFEYTGGTDTTYWLQLQNPTNSTYYEPTKEALGWKPGQNPGASCASATFSNVPADTFGDFSKVTGATAATGYPICVPSYFLAWDDYSSVYGCADAEQAQARTVKDYLDMILGDVAQNGLAARDYAPLPASLLTLAKGGASQIQWNKGGSCAGGNPSPTPTASPTATPTATVTVQPTPTPVSNVFSIASARVSKTNVITLVLRLPGRGVVSATAKALSNGGFVVGKATGTAGSSYNLPITIRPNARARALLKKVKKLKVRVTVTYTPTGGTAASKSKTVTLKGHPKKKKKHKK